MATKSRHTHENHSPPADKPRRRRLTQAEEDAILGRLIEESRQEAQREGYASKDDIIAILRKND